MTLSRLLRIARHRYRSLLQSRSMDDETARELAFHFEELVREQIEEGVPPEEARAAARRILGSQPRLEEECRDERRATWLRDLQQDLVYASRLVRAHRSFTIVAVTSLALGIGANAAVLGIIRSVLLGPLPLPEADRIVVIRTHPLDNPQQSQRAQLTDYVAWRDALVVARDGHTASGSTAGGNGKTGTGSSGRAIEAIGVSLVDRRDWGAENDTTPAERIEGQLVSPSMFAALGVPPLIGRVFTDEDEARAPDSQVIVISHRLWQRRFGSDPQIVGRHVRLNGVTTTIIGVMPPAFRYPDNCDSWAPLRITPRLLQGSVRFFGVTARLAPGATIDQATGEVAVVAARLARETPGRSAGWGARVQSLREAMYGWTRQPLATLQTAVGLVLVIACVNVAGLLLARGRARAPELALRASLGAGRGRIVRQLLAESLLLSGLGGALGLIVAWWGLRLSSLIVTPVGVQIDPVAFDLRIAGLIALLSIVSGLAFGLAPAFAATRRDLVHAFNGARGGTHARGTTAAAGGRAMWGTLAAAQIALAFVLLIGTGLLLHSVIRFATRPLNFEPEGLLTFEYRIPAGEYIRPLATPVKGATFDVAPPPSLTIARIHERLRAIPGTASVAGINHAHVNSFIVPVMALQLEHEPGAGTSRATGATAGGALRASYFLITPDFFKTMGAGIVRGRELRDTDAAGAPWVAIVNETAARRFWPGLDPIGQHLTVDIVGDEQPREIVGVVRDIPVRRDREAPEPIVYVSYLQQPSRYREPWGGMFGQMNFVIRTPGDPLQLVPAVRQAVAEIDPERPIANIARVDRQMDIGVTIRGVFALTLGVFAAVAMALAAIGIYGTLAYAVAQRTREIGIRIALGATRREVFALIGGRAIVVIAAGLIAGLAGALALTRLIVSQLWGVTPTDPLTFASVSLLVVCVALLASFVPVRRAMRVDPTIALKHE